MKGSGVEIALTSSLFKQDHRILEDITSLNVATGVAGGSAFEYIPYHIRFSETVVHKIYRCHEYPSRLLLQLIPESPISKP